MNHATAGRGIQNQQPSIIFCQSSARANGAKSTARAHVEHPFAHQKRIMGLLIRTIGLARASAAVTFANMAYNMKRWCWLDRRVVPA